MRRVAQMALGALALSGLWSARPCAAKPASQLLPAVATFASSTSVIPDGQGPYIGDEQGVRCHLQTVTGDFLFSPTLQGRQRSALLDLGSPVPNPCTGLLLTPGVSQVESIEYMNVDQVYFETGTAQHWAWIQFNNGTFHLGTPEASCPQLVWVTFLGTGTVSPNKRSWRIYTETPTTGERKQSVKGQVQTIGYYAVSLDITVTEQ